MTLSTNMCLLKKTAITAILALVAAGFTPLTAKNRCVPKLYAFGFAASFNDSTVHFTDIQEMDSVWINDKNKFLIDREDYSYQLRNYMESRGLPHRTCVISYALTLKDAQKKYSKMRDRYVKRGGVDIKMIPNEEFKFTAIKLDE